MKKELYLTPETEAVEIVLEGQILDGSGENLGRRQEEFEWE